MNQNLLTLVKKKTVRSNDSKLKPFPVVLQVKNRISYKKENDP